MMAFRLATQLPAIAMVALQFVYASMNTLHRAALVKGMSPTVYIFYRQAIATLVVSPVAYFSRGASDKSRMEIGGFLLTFFSSLIGVVLDQMLYYEGLYLASSSVGAAMSNLVPAITFVIAALVGLEQVNMKTASTIAKILGTILCVGGAVSMTLLKGPKLHSFLTSLGGEHAWLLGCLSLFGSCLALSFRLILQVRLTKYCPHHMSLTAWTCFLATLQSGIIALFLDRDPQAWNFSSTLQLTCCLFSGVLGSGFQYFVQAWCISQKGPFYFAVYSPLDTVITTVFASIFLHEELFFGSLLGGLVVIIGLYVVLWGKSEEMKKSVDLIPENNEDDQTIDEIKNHDNDLEQPLLDRR